MALTRRHPKQSKVCAFCNYWESDIKLKCINSTVGYEYEHYTSGKCMKTNCKTQAYVSCAKYEPSVDAKKLL